jgi:hypothetical protein
MSTTPSGIITATNVRNVLNVINSAGGTTNYPTNTISFNDSLVRKLVNTSGTTSLVVDSSLQLWLDAGNTSSYSSGSTWNDLSGKGNHGTLTNSPTFVSGTSGYFNFGSGASQYVSFTYKTPIQSASTAFTWSIWVYPTQNQDSYVLMGYRGSILQFYKLTTQKFEMYPAEVFNAFTLNVWQNICVVYDGTQSGTGNMKMYVNGNIVGLRDADQPSLSSSVMPFYIGGDPFAGEYATARISQVMVYSRALTPAEVSQNYNALRTRYAAISMNDMRNKAGPDTYGSASDTGACGIVASTTFSQNFNNGTYGTYRVDTINSPLCRATLSSTYSSNQTNVNITVSSQSGYISGKTDITITINAGVIISSSSTGTAAFIIGGTNAGDTVTIINNGTIVGKGGAGGTGGGGQQQPGSAGGNGGPAISLGCAVTLTNNGTIGGGGGGGGGGSIMSGANTVTTRGGGGGGGAGYGAGGTYNGSAGSATAGGGGGSNGSSGGSGGGLGASGGTGSGASFNMMYSAVSISSGYSGGSPGAAVAKNGNTLTWNPQGTTYGTIS